MTSITLPRSHDQSPNYVERLEYYAAAFNSHFGADFYCLFLDFYAGNIRNDILGILIFPV